MSSDACFIQAYCSIRDQVVKLNGDTVYEEISPLPLTDFLKHVYRHLELSYPRFHKMDVLCKAVLLATELISQKEPLADTNTALVLANCASSYYADEKHAASLFREEGGQASPALFVYTLPNIAAGEISIRHQLFSEQVFFTFERFSPEWLAPYQEDLLHKKKADKVLGGWTEAKDGNCDVLLYLIGTSGSIHHTPENLKKIYNQEL